MLAELRASGLSTLLVDRNYRAVLTHTDQAVVLEKGRVVMAGHSAELSGRLPELAQHLGI